MYSTNKTLYRLLIFLIFISTASAAYLLFYTPKDNNSSHNFTVSSTTDKNTQTKDTKPPIVETKNNVNKTIENKPIEKTTSTPATSTLDKIEETVLVKFKIEDKEYEIAVKPGSSAYQAMTTLQDTGKISFSTKVFSGLGHFVEEVNGIKNSPSTGFYWTFYINNQEARLGISNYIIKPNDLITWKYENK